MFGLKTDASFPRAATDRPSLRNPFIQGLRRTREGILSGVADRLLGRSAINDELLEDLEARLLTADLGVEATNDIISQLKTRLARKQLADHNALYGALREEMLANLLPVSRPLVLPNDQARPFVLLVLGTNGAGKTTTIGKLAQRFHEEGRRVLLAAGDTHRAAAIEQLQAWGARHHLPVIAQHKGADAAAVIFDALQAAKAQHCDVLIADTAGRLHTQGDLMKELTKIYQVVTQPKLGLPCEAMLVIDASTGQNALTQARAFQAALPVSGITLTKLDGTAKGGIIFAIAKTLKIPIRFVGVGEQQDDLRVFDAQAFVEALLAGGR